MSTPAVLEYDLCGDPPSPLPPSVKRPHENTSNEKTKSRSDELEEKVKKLQDENALLNLANEQLQKNLKTLETGLAEAKQVNIELALSLKDAKGCPRVHVHPTHRTSLLQIAYPSDSDALLSFETVEKVDTSPIIGSFVRPKDAAVTASKTISFARKYSAPPDIITGFTKLDIARAHNIRVTCYTSNLKNSSCDINIDGCPKTTKLYNTTCTWLEIGAGNLDFQYGRFHTQGDCPWVQPQKTNKKQITFQRSYASPPQVMVWLTAFDMDREHGSQLKSYASDITTTGFTLHIDTWGDCVLFSAVASWVAYPTGKAGVLSGHFTTNDMRPSKYPQLFNSGYITFPKGHFSNTPRVFVAIDSLDTAVKGTLRLLTKTSSVSSWGMSWHLDAWSDTILNFAGASYIAFA